MKSPLEGLRRIAAVSIAGALYERAAVDALLVYAERQAESWSIGCKVLWRVIQTSVRSL